MKKYPDFWHVIIGNGPVGAFLAFISLAVLCAVISIMIEVGRRDVASTNTPYKFSWKFMIASNVSRFFANFLLVPIFIRLTYEYADPKWMLFISLGIGFGVDRLAMIAKKYGILTTNKLASAVAEKIAAKEDSTPKP